ncbi:hypothetical protein GLAREA_11839 [Glarea lozoyensis ATCC 20868]|uniref:C3H1-type domain-containing protein n=1 Tax=Glarea lozoyensis (strain ATCC 20868 / MF5171) TaxID=1116229 RepID=S3DF35_GLAL2|nr:uncharacterized protein GLAREA_11839 [Glarea lozoyensis ATCC 20868]EPE25258.1 hypothetical protein GLAREA_11839 [Glarea lozoyensis ATCC 20868]
MSPTQTCPEQEPKPSYFVIRSNGEVVPLIAIDELPLGLSIVNAPRNLTLDETVGMLSLGLQQRSKNFYELVKKDLRGAQIETRNDTAENRSTSISKLPQLPSSAEKSSISTGSTVYDQTCRHWCHHGICKWGKQCRYRHVMPMTLRGLQEVGLDNWPGWYRRANEDCFAPDSPRSLRERQRTTANKDLSKEPENNMILELEKGTPRGDAGGLKASRISAFEPRAGERRRKLLNGTPKKDRTSARGVDDRVLRREVRIWEEDVDSDSTIFSNGPDMPRENAEKGRLTKEVEGGLIDV